MYEKRDELVWLCMKVSFDRNKNVLEVRLNTP
jgi:hypothetical protein